MATRALNEDGGKMNETVEQGNVTVDETQENNATVSTENTQEKIARTFTQQEVDDIVLKRLNKERAKFADYEDLKAKVTDIDVYKEKAEKTDALQAQLEAITKANEVRDIREKVASDTKVPANLLTGLTEEACLEQAQAILAFAKTNGYPRVKDSGELQNIPTGSTKQQFANWFNETINK